jgi:hypothetical protein
MQRAEVHMTQMETYLLVERQLRHIQFQHMQQRDTRLEAALDQVELVLVLMEARVLLPQLQA